RCTQVAPSLYSALATTLMSSYAERSAAASPPLAPPRTTRSKVPPFSLTGTNSLLWWLVISDVWWGRSPHCAADDGTGGGDRRGKSDAPARRAPLCPRSLPGVLLGDTDQGAGTRARSALGGVSVRSTVVERRTRDVQMCPGDAFVDELLEEDTGGEHAGPALARHIGDVGHGRVQTRTQLLGERHRPGRLTRGLGGGHDLVARLVVTHDREHPGAERDQLGAGQSGDVHDQVGVVLLRADQGIGHDQTALGIGVEDLHGFAAVDGQHIGGALCGA